MKRLIYQYSRVSVSVNLRKIYKNIENKRKIELKVIVTLLKEESIYY